MTSISRPTKSELFTAYNKLRAEAHRNGDVKKIERLNKALGILQSKDYYQGEKAIYLPCIYSCGCKDWEFRYAKNRKYNGPCKHMLAEELLTMIAERRTEHEVTHLINVYSELEA